MPSQTALIWAGATGAAVAAVGAAGLYWTHPDLLRPNPVPATVTESAEPTAAPAPAPDKTAALAPTPSVPTPSPVMPAFDVVSVEPSGDTVVAGRAAPNVKVALVDAGRTLAETMTDAQGQFVIIPAPLPPGDHSLTLSSGAGGPAETSKAIPVSVAQPPVKTAAAAQGAASAPPTSAAPRPASSPVAIRSVDASADGGLVARGSADPNATVRLYISGAYVGDARTKDDGRWSLTIEHGMTPGAYEVRADEIDPGSAKVVARADAPVSIPTLAAPEKPRSPAAPTALASSADLVLDAVQTHHVERGHTLWGISQKFYGDGSRYGMIFSANAGQIRDPNLIYPGQTFFVPKGESKP
ncbi:LysM peptidoglycan-binding domain-containing protein [Roseiarcus sp.]|uniref:LysM peptidoglycan-binding domain-containing protein n=1 Tax=Roseiarcus sp. TaxID=1969460 RepID=UPI003F991A00